MVRTLCVLNSQSGVVTCIPVDILVDPSHFFLLSAIHPGILGTIYFSPYSHR